MFLMFVSKYTLLWMHALLCDILNLYRFVMVEIIMKVIKVFRDRLCLTVLYISLLYRLQQFRLWFVMNWKLDDCEWSIAVY